MSDTSELIVESPLGRREVDSSGSPVGVSRMDADEAYAGVGELLQEFLNESSQDAWERIRAKLDDAGVETWVHQTSVYFTGPDGERLELIADPLGEMYGSTVL